MEIMVIEAKGNPRPLILSDSREIKIHVYDIRQTANVS